MQKKKTILAEQVQTTVISSLGGDVPSLLCISRISCFYHKGIKLLWLKAFFGGRWLAQIFEGAELEKEAVAEEGLRAKTKTPMMAAIKTSVQP